MHPTNLKRMYVVDGGLTFNSPYPLLLRPQRNVDLLLSFDFSARPSDSSPPFKVGASSFVCIPYHRLLDYDPPPKKTTTTTDISLHTFTLSPHPRMHSRVVWTFLLF